MIDQSQYEQEALDVGMAFLKKGKPIPDALYLVYEHFRTRFIEERGLADLPPGNGTEWVVALQDAVDIRDRLNDIWTEKLQEAFTASDA